MISEDIFLKECNEFIKISNKLHENWQLLTNRSITYLSKKCRFPISNSSNEEFFFAEYNVIYSRSYSVPCIYIRANWPTGKMLTLEELIAVLKVSIPEEERLRFLTQTEHPLSGQVTFWIHPCQTATIMEESIALKERNKHYVVSFLSIYGQLLGLQVPIHWFHSE